MISKLCPVFGIIILLCMGCTQAKQSIFYEVAGETYEKNKCFFEFCVPPFVFNAERHVNPHILEFQSDGTILSITTQSNFRSVGIGVGELTLGTYTFWGEEHLVIDRRDKKIEYKVHREQGKLILQGTGETLELIPIQVIQSKIGIYAILILAGITSIASLFAWKYLSPRVIPLFNHPLYIKSFSSVVVGFAATLSLAGDGEVLDNGVIGNILIFFLAIALAALGIYLYAITYHVATFWPPGKGTLDATIMVSYKGFLLIAIAPLCYQLPYFILSSNTLNGQFWHVRQIINHVAGSSISFTIRTVVSLVLLFGFLRLANKLAEARKISTPRSLLVLIVFDIFVEIPGLSWFGIIKVD